MMFRVRNKIVTSIFILALVILGSCFVGKLDSKVLANASDSISQEMLSALSVKCQVKENANGSADLRIVSTVDALETYGTAGFDIYVEKDGVTELLDRYERSYVTDKIGAKTDGVSFEYNPKVFDTISNYFITVTVTGIPESDFGYGFLIKPFVTMTGDTQRLYGTSRYIKVNDAFVGNEYLSVPVATLNDTTGYSVKVGDTTYSSGIEFYNDATNDSNYTHVRVKLNSTDLSSVTKVSVLNGSTEVSNTTYRNLYSKSNVADTTWYDNAKVGTTEYVLATKADLYGLASVVNGGNSLAGKTIYLGADIKVNTATLDPSKYASNDEWNSVANNCLPWTPIGGGASSTDDSKKFAGTFDGLGCTVSGLYMKSDGYYLGMFGVLSTDSNSILKNFKLTNTYFESTSANGNEARGLGSVVGRGSGNLYTIYSNAILVSSNFHTGGLIGTQWDKDTTFNIDNCWYDGTIKAYTWIGGIIGFVGYDTVKITDVNMTDCLVTADMTSTADSPFIGGLAGRSTGGSFISCISEGTITSSSGARGFVGNHVGARNLNIAKCYNATSSSDNCYWGSVKPTLRYAERIEAEQLKDTYAYSNTILDFYVKDANDDGKWLAIENTMPILKSFKEEQHVMADISALSRTVVADTSWYDDSKSEFTIYTANELYGLAQLCNEGNQFAGKTINLGTDIKVNYGKSTDWKEGKSLPSNQWIPIGGGTTSRDDTKYFVGTFNGQNHTISGLYMNSNGRFLGLFGFTCVNNSYSSTIKNLRLVNGYFKSTATDTHDACGFGSIAGRAEGTIDTVYSDVILEGTNIHMGGIVGTQFRAGSQLSITNSWYNGEICGSTWVGGLIGFTYYHSSNIPKTYLTDCLVTADMTATAVTSYVGGLAGRNTGGKFLSCVVEGTVTTSGTPKGYVALHVGTSALEIEKCYYATNSSTDYAYGSVEPTLTTSTKLTSAQLTDKEAYLNTLLDFDGKTDGGRWVAIKNSLLQLKSFADEDFIVDLSSVERTATE